MNHEPYNLGLDFGTTYSLIYRLDDIKRNSGGRITSYTPKACTSGENDAPIPSLVLRKPDDKLTFGKGARACAGDSDSNVIYRGFKMMLAEEDDKQRTNRGYDSSFTPELIVEKYLDDLLKTHLDRFHKGGCIDKLVVGVPEVWYSIDTIDCRTTLKDILSSFDYVKKVELVSEPAAACACFAEELKHRNGKNYNGRMLLVDYGGGTLDIALCEVKTSGAHCEVSVEKRAGAGINDGDSLGQAGLAFLEEVVHLALAPLGKSREELRKNPGFQVCMNEIEDRLINTVGTVNDVFSAVSDPEDVSMPFVPKMVFEDKDGNLSKHVVTYGMLATAYNKVIHDVLSKTLSEVLTYMDNHSIAYDNKREDFKIYPIGGFCNFYLTVKQIYQTFDSPIEAVGEDPRFPSADGEKRERAIAQGAALIANEIVDFRPRAPYSFGISDYEEKAYLDGNKEPVSYWAFHKGQEIHYDEPMFIRDNYGNIQAFYADNIPAFVFCDGDDEDYAIHKEPIDEFKKKLIDEHYEGQNLRSIIGFSLDRSNIISLYKYDFKAEDIYDVIDDQNFSKVINTKPIRLTNLKGLLGNIIPIHLKANRRTPK